MGPVGVAVDADSDIFMFHGSGIIESRACGTELNHAVTAVGYGYDYSLDEEYVIIKNSYGEDWGEDGYVRISLTTRYGSQGVCGVLSEADYAYAYEYNNL